MNRFLGRGLSRGTMSWVKDVSESEFEAAVLRRSHEVPVVVDFWAAWCAPCRMLGPTLEREVNALEGRVELAKVDVDQAQALSQRFHVQGIPAVMAFSRGEVVSDFTGARDAGFVKRWLRELAPSDAQRALDGANDEAALRPLLELPEVASKAALRLGRLLLTAGKSDEALEVLARVTGDDAPAADALRRQAAFALDAAAYGGEARARAVLREKSDDADAQWALASAQAAQGELAAALEGFLALVAAHRRYRDDGARKALVTLFDALGPQHALTREYRRRLQILL